MQEEIEIVDYKTLDFNLLEFTEPEKNKSGSMVASAQYNGTDLYIQTPRLMCSSLVKTDNRCALDLEFDKSHGQFYEFITSIDDYSIIQIQKHSKKWFSKEFPLDVVEEFYKTPVKIGRKSKPPSLKIKVPMAKGVPNLTVYDNKNNTIEFKRIKERTKVLTILKFIGLKFLKQQVICEWIPIQIKSFSQFTGKRNIYLIKDNLITDDESDHSKYKNKKKQQKIDKIIVEKIDALPINNLKLSSNEVTEVNEVNEVNDNHELESVAPTTQEPSLSQKELEMNILTDTTSFSETLADEAREPVIDITNDELVQESAQESVAAIITEELVQESVVPTSIEEPLAVAVAVAVEEPSQEPLAVAVVEEPSQEPLAVAELREESAQESLAVAEESVQESLAVAEEPTQESESEIIEEPTQDSVAVDEVTTTEESAQEPESEITEELANENDDDDDDDDENIEDLTSSYDDFDLGISDNELSEIDIIPTDLPDKVLKLEETPEELRFAYLENELREKNFKLEKLESDFSNLLTKITGLTDKIDKVN